jgi:hypothetical protein
MPVLISTDHTREISRSPGANVEAHKTVRVQSHPVELVLLSDTAAREKAVMTRLILGALSGTIFAVAAIFTTVIDWTVLGWRNFWHRNDRDRTRTGPLMSQSSERTSPCF